MTAEPITYAQAKERWEFAVENDETDKEVVDAAEIMALAWWRENG